VAVRKYQACAIKAGPLNFTRHGGFDRHLGGAAAGMAVRGVAGRAA